jgi:hypothetical protein
MLKRMVEYATGWVLFVLLVAFAVSCNGCSGEITAKTAFYHEGENNGEVWKSRQANPNQPVQWSWGEAGN